MTTTLINTLADAFPTTLPVDDGLTFGGVHVPGWALGALATLVGVVVILKFARKFLIPEVGGAAKDVLEQLKQLRDDASVAKAKAETAEKLATVGSERQTNVAQAVLYSLAASPEPPNAPELRQKAMEHAQAALAPCDVTPTTAPPTPEQP